MQGVRVVGGPCLLGVFLPLGVETAAADSCARPCPEFGEDTHGLMVQRRGHAQAALDGFELVGCVRPAAHDDLDQRPGHRRAVEKAAALPEELGCLAMQPQVVEQPHLVHEKPRFERLAGLSRPQQSPCLVATSQRASVVMQRDQGVAVVGAACAVEPLLQQADGLGRADGRGDGSGQADRRPVALAALEQTAQPPVQRARHVGPLEGALRLNLMVHASHRLGWIRHWCGSAANESTQRSPCRAG